MRSLRVPRLIAGLGGLLRPDGRSARDVKVALGFSFGTLHWEFIRSLMALQQLDFATLATGGKPSVYYLIPQRGLYIAENRNRAVKQFLKTDADWLLQIDTDIEFPPDLPRTMLALTSEQRKVVCASVPLTPPLPTCGMNRLEGRPGEFVYLEENQLTPEGTEVDAVATAVSIVHREVFLAIADRIGQCWYLQSGPASIIPDMREDASRLAWSDAGRMRDREYVHIGEDVLFSLRAEDAGFRSYCALVPGLRHYKVLPLTHDRDPEPAAAVEAANG